MLSQLIVLIINFLIVVPAFAQEEKKHDPASVAKERRTNQAAEGARLGNGLTSRSRNSGGKRGQNHLSFQLAVSKSPPSSKISKSSTEAEQVLITRLPSRSSRTMSRNVHLNSECEVVSINLNSGGTATELTPNRCKNFLSEYRASILYTRNRSSISIVDSLQTEYPKHNWAKMRE